MPQTRPAHWAALPPAPIAGLENFHIVVPNRFYRGAQPTTEGMRALERMGIKTVISLRQHHSDEGILPGTTLSLRNYGFDTWHPGRDDVVNFLKTMTEANALPVYLHCQFGSDRTGTMAAIYRIVVQGWEKQDAIHEMTRGGFGYHPLWINLIHFLLTLDVPALKQEAGLAP